MQIQTQKQKQIKTFRFYSPESFVIENPTEEQRKLRIKHQEKLSRRDTNTIEMLNPNRIVVVAEIQNGNLNFAVAKCSIQDTFNKKKGRTIAEGRLYKGKIYKSIPIEDFDNNVTVKTFVSLAKDIISEIEIKAANHEKLYPVVNIEEPVLH